jgi:hypothetical protein
MSCYRQQTRLGQVWKYIGGMREAQRSGVLRHRSQGAHNIIIESRAIINADQIEGAVMSVHLNGLVLEYLDPCAAKLASNPICVGPVIVVP